MKGLNVLTIILVIIGALNWGFVGFASFDVVAYLLGPMTIASRIVYAAVGLSAVYQIQQMIAVPHRGALLAGAQ